MFNKIIWHLPILKRKAVLPGEWSLLWTKRF